MALGYTVRANAADGTIDLAYTGATPGRTLNIERRVPFARRAAARARGASRAETSGRTQVTRDHPLPQAAGTWQDRQVRFGVDYEYRAREGNRTWGAWRS